MGKIRAMTGNTAAYTGAALCRPDLIAAYPITPQSSVVEGLAGLVYNGKLDAPRQQGRLCRTQAAASASADRRSPR